jgi:hypothetical protein
MIGYVRERVPASALRRAAFYLIEDDEDEGGEDGIYSRFAVAAHGQPVAYGHIVYVDAYESFVFDLVGTHEGWGPLAYEIAMTIAQERQSWLTASQWHSPEAEAVWWKFYERDDVVTAPLSPRAIKVKHSYKYSEHEKLEDYEKVKYRLRVPLILPQPKKTPEKFFDDPRIEDQIASLTHV